MGASPARTAGEGFMKHHLYPELEQLFSCYLHEDWYYDYPTRDTALQAGIAGLPLDA
jgi:hypothetical protein